MIPLCGSLIFISATLCQRKCVHTPYVDQCRSTMFSTKRGVSPLSYPRDRDEHNTPPYGCRILLCLFHHTHCCCSAFCLRGYGPYRTMYPITFRVITIENQYLEVETQIVVIRAVPRYVDIRRVFYCLEKCNIFDPILPRNIFGIHSTAAYFAFELGEG